ncbi:MAG: phytoene/squalene synthase family protein, partial [Anaerolineae bacterium]|nr:phytoene/squalene synthase family protein [Anaerolineae bacterium]
MFVEEHRLGFPDVSVDRLHQPIALVQDYAECRRIMQEASKNYSFAGAFLPSDKRPHVEALYALMRVGDDRVDVSHRGFASPLAAVDDWETAYWRTFETGDSPEPVMRAYLNTAIRFGIPAEVMTPYFRAMREDLTINRFPTFGDLMHYMDGSAIPVGRAMTYIMGVRSPYKIIDVLPGADALAVAMQLSNFWRDIGDDYHRIDRIYIPQEDMERFGVTENVLAEKRVTPELIALLEWEFDRTEAYYQAARAAV